MTTKLALRGGHHKLTAHSVPINMSEPREGAVVGEVINNDDDVSTP
jgi:hypothetical protein